MLVGCGLDVVSQESIGGCKLFSTTLKVSDECLVISSKAEMKAACST